LRETADVGVGATNGGDEPLATATAGIEIAGAAEGVVAVAEVVDAVEDGVAELVAVVAAAASAAAAAAAAASRC
jgi:hypothetical protein